MLGQHVGPLSGTVEWGDTVTHFKTPDDAQGGTAGSSTDVRNVIIKTMVLTIVNKFNFRSYFSASCPTPYLE